MMMFEFSSLVGIKFGFRHSQLTQQVRVCSGLRCKNTSEFWLRFKVDYDSVRVLFQIRFKSAIGQP
ncbi:hypothetical protein HanXRQr2_Chr13g0580341 [Helianthus annuus]|uniref:Uncharacterized protein n=1 Tax=Helianthus annuus TaxID=4232 RepID=A0A9K3EGK7_HELAN|nr:hypothetical protein HanXRQr2_Chr13g0580341 [Helianthus annuus]